MIRPEMRSFGKAFFVLAFVSASAFSTAALAAEPTVVVNGKTLKLLGSGLREFLFVDIYRMSAYSESGDCAPGKIVYANEIKTLRLAMLRTIPASRMQSTLRDTLEGALPKDKDNTALQKKIDSFLSRLNQDLSTGTYVELTYIPGQGTLIKSNSKVMGPATPGKDFADLLWKSYFGADTCCAGLKASILKECKSRE